MPKKEDKIKTTDDDASKGPCLIPAADRDVGEELVDEQVLGQLEEVGLVVAPLQDVLLLEGVAESVKFECISQPNQEIIKQVVGSTKVMDFLTQLHLLCGVCGRHTIGIYLISNQRSEGEFNVCPSSNLGGT